jgi:PAS domain-containing protein
MPDRISVAAADFVRNIGAWQEQALKTPIAITYHGRERLILLSAERYASADFHPPQSREEERAAALVLDQISQGFLALDSTLTITELNLAAEAYFGRPKADLLGRTFGELYPHTDASVAADHIRRVVVTRTPVSFEMASLIFPDVRLSVTLFPLLGGVGLLFTNTTEQDALRTSGARARAIMTGIAEHRDVALAQLDVRGRFVRVDGKFSVWAGFDPAALLNCRLIDLIAPVDRRRLSDGFDAAVQARRASAFETILITKDLREQRLSLSFAPLEDADGKAEVWTVMSLGPPQADIQLASKKAVQ